VKSGRRCRADHDDFAGFLVSIRAAMDDAGEAGIVGDGLGFGSKGFVKSPTGLRVVW
jgi:hypothetical protein